MYCTSKSYNNCIFYKCHFLYNTVRELDPEPENILILTATPAAKNPYIKPQTDFLSLFLTGYRELTRQLLR